MWGQTEDLSMMEEIQHHEDSTSQLASCILLQNQLWKSVLISVIGHWDNQRWWYLSLLFEGEIQVLPYGISNSSLVAPLFMSPSDRHRLAWERNEGHPQTRSSWEHFLEEALCTQGPLGSIYMRHNYSSCIFLNVYLQRSLRHLCNKYNHSFLTSP